MCVDSSVIVKQVVHEDHSLEARALISWAVREQQLIVAPQLLTMEVANILLKKTRRPPTLTPYEAISALEDVLAMPILLESAESLHRNAFRIAVSYQLPAAYDAYYLALAADAKCDFWTADLRLVRALAGRVPYVHWIGDFPP